MPSLPSGSTVRALGLLSTSFALWCLCLAPASAQAALPTFTLQATAAPTALPAPGGTFAFVVVVTNTHTEPLTVLGLTDSSSGDISGTGNCTVGSMARILPGGTYRCAFPASYTGLAGERLTNTVAVKLADLSRNVVMASDDAVFTITAALPPDLSPPTPTPPRPTPASITAVFDLSPKSVRVSRSGCFRYRLLATPLIGGQLGLKSTTKVKIGSARQFMHVAPKAFAASATTAAEVKFKLSAKNLGALKRAKAIRYVVTAVMAGRRFATTVKLKAP